MINFNKRSLQVFLLAIALSGCSGRALKNPWKDAQTPSPGSPEAIGGYSAGCVRGAISMYPDGKGYRVMRLSRRRFYGHPNLVRFIERWASHFAKVESGSLLIGDLAMPRGGPTLSGHASHQSGLDVDVWYLQMPDSATSVSLDARENISSPSVVAPGGKDLIKGIWTEKMASALQLAANDAEVERIFVHSAVKRALCKKSAGKPWLRKIRPWWGHDDHFHVRLRCPTGEASCVAQTPPASDECEREFETDFVRELGEGSESSSPKMPKLPPACDGILTQ